MVPGVNTLLKISLLTSVEVEAKKSYKSRVADIGENYLQIEIPLDEQTGRTGFFPPGTEITANFIGVDGAIYHFQSKVVGRKKEGLPFILISLPKTEEMKRIQRRNYFRTPATLEVAIKTLDPRGLHFLTKTVDVGGGGIAFSLNILEPINKEELLYCWITLPFKDRVDHVQFIGKVVRVAQHKEIPNLFTVSLMFTDIREAERNKIIRYCLERQVELRKKGSL